MKLGTAILIGVGVGAALGVSGGFLFQPDSSLVENVPTRADSGNEWINWHQSLVSRFGVKEANQLWMTAYNKQNPNIMGDSSTRQYLESQGIKFSENFLNATIDWTSNAVTGIGNTISGFWKTGKTIVYLVVGGTIIAVIMILYGVMKHPEYVGEAAKFAA